ncbi:MAG: TM1812 family CRISPR-associated protein [Candidatus Baldrarchaeia archaeon]
MKKKFFAYSGLLDNYTLVRKKNGRLFLRYKLEHFREKLKGWLKSPED